MKQKSLLGACAVSTAIVLVSGAAIQATSQLNHRPASAEPVHVEKTLIAAETEKNAPLPTQSFREEHKAVLLHLGHVVEWTEQLQAEQPGKQKRTAENIVRFFEEDMKPHAQWEEKRLYPVIDKLTKSADYPFTSTMRYEHRIMDRWISELAAEVKKPQPDYDAFTRRTHNLVGLLLAHFEQEEEVLLPYVDKSMTAEEFRAALGDDGAHR
jgi:iron-sulfur cluster repair protein YtfE (RIC family)